MQCLRYFTQQWKLMSTQLWILELITSWPFESLTSTWSHRDGHQTLCPRKQAKTGQKVPFGLSQNMAVPTEQLCFDCICWFLVLVTTDSSVFIRSNIVWNWWKRSIWVCLNQRRTNYENTVYFVHQRKSVWENPRIRSRTEFVYANCKRIHDCKCLLIFKLPT